MLDFAADGCRGRRPSELITEQPRWKTLRACGVPWTASPTVTLVKRCPVQSMRRWFHRLSRGLCKPYYRQLWGTEVGSPGVGEVMHLYGEVPWRYHQVTSNSGTYSYHFQLLGWAQSSPFYAEGTVSGKLFQFKAGPYNESFSAGPGEVFHWVSREKYVADNRDWFQCQASYHITVNANGDLSIEKRDLVDCNCKIDD